MISVELWCARIGAFNSKSYSSGSLSSNLFFLHCCTNKDIQLQENNSTWPTAQKQPHLVAALTVVLSSRLYSISEPGEKHTATNFSAEHGFLSAISIKQLCSPSHFTCSCSSSSSSASSSFSSSSSSSSSPSGHSHDNVFQYHSPQLRDVLVILLTVIAVIFWLLIISGDIETNPGPIHGVDDKPNLVDLLHMSYTGMDGEDIHFRLMDQVTPHWKRLAIALKFPQHVIAIMEHRDDPVYYLLTEWLREANKENDSRPVTWRTFITALRDANIQEEASVLENHFIQTPITTSTDGQDTLTICHGYVRVHVEPDVPDRLLSLRGDYVDMLIKLGETKLKKKVFKRFKLFLSHVCDENSIQDCSAVSTVVELLVEKLIISLFNIDILCICCRRFVLINGPVQSYKCQLKEFLSSTIVKNFKCSLKTELSRLNNVERVTLKLDESRTKNTLKNLKELLFHFFSNASKALVLCETRPGCVCVTWLVPISLVPTLRSMAEQLSHDYLASQGVLELVIGLRIVPNEERPHLVHQPSSETRKSDLVRQWSSSQDSTNWTECQRSFSSSSEMTIMSNNSIQKPAQICTTVTQPSTTGYLPLQTTYTQQATGITTTATAATPTSKVQQPFSSEACSVSNLQLVCEVHNATTGSIIRGATTTVHPIKKKYSSVPPGTPLCVQVKANRGCYIYIINIGSSGKVSTLIPNEYEPQNYLTPDATLVFPSKEADYEFELDSHSGEETLVLLAYSTQCNIDQAERDCLRLKKYAISDQHNFLGSLEVQFSVK